ncbi:MAG: tetratricopeptide repeat protein [Bacteroidota bacterium]|nr:tetratricopeptide repeat protein [Bacteroidota bacterium]
MDTAEDFFEKGNKYSVKGDLDKAIENYDKAIELDPTDGILYFGRGNAWYKKGEFEKAIEDYNSVIKYKPEFAGAYNNRGNSYLRINDNDKAIEDYHNALRINPNEAETYNNIGICYGKKGEYDKSIKNYNEAIRIKPDYAFAFKNRAYDHYLSGEYNEAISDYNQAKEIYKSKGETKSINEIDAFIKKISDLIQSKENFKLRNILLDMPYKIFLLMALVVPPLLGLLLVKEIFNGNLDVKLFNFKWNAIIMGINILIILGFQKRTIFNSIESAKKILKEGWFYKKLGLCTLTIILVNLGLSLIAIYTKL